MCMTHNGCNFSDSRAAHLCRCSPGAHAAAMIPGAAGPIQHPRIAGAVANREREERSMDGAATDLMTRDRPAVSASTLAEAFRLTAAERPGDVAIRTKGDQFTISWAELRARVDNLAGGLAGLGLGPGETIALMLSNRPEFHICDLAAMMLGAIPFSIYNTYAP